MSQNLPNMLEKTLEKIREMVNANTVVGDPITTVDGVTIIPVSNVSIGMGGGGSDFSSKNATKENPFGGGVGAGVKVTPVAFLIVKEGNVFSSEDSFIYNINKSNSSLMQYGSNLGALIS